MKPPSTAFSFLLLLAVLAGSVSPAGEFRAGAFSVDITPIDWPVIVNGYTTERTTSNVRDPLHANCLVLEDADTTVAMVTVDSCLIPRDVLDMAKGYIATATGIPSSNIVISATHTHDAPSVMAALGSRADADYVRFLQGKLAEGVTAAAARTEPAQVGWTTVDDYQDTHCRRWVLRPDRTFTNVFGEQDRAMMHPGYQDSSTVGPTGPVNPALSLLSVQTADGGAAGALRELLAALLCDEPRLGRMVRAVYGPRRGGAGAGRFRLRGGHVARDERRPDVVRLFASQ